MSAACFFLIITGPAVVLRSTHTPVCRRARALPICANTNTAEKLILPRRGSSPDLPELSDEDVSVLRAGKFLSRQTLEGASGSGFAVQEVRADVNAAWRCIADFDSYPQLISTVRSAKPYTPEGDSRWGELAAGETCYDFLVSRIRLPLAVRFTISEADRYAVWVLDRPSWVLRESTGFWHVQAVPERPGYVRVWFRVAVLLKARVPRFIIGLVSRLGLRKACFWVRGALEGGGNGPSMADAGAVADSGAA